MVGATEKPVPKIKEPSARLVLTEPACSHSRISTLTLSIGRPAASVTQPARRYDPGGTTTGTGLEGDGVGPVTALRLQAVTSTRARGRKTGRTFPPYSEPGPYASYNARHEST